MGPVPTNGRVAQEPQSQLDPQVHCAQSQAGLSHPTVGFPQLQSGPQLHGEHVQFGFSHSVLLVMGQFWHSTRACGQSPIAP